MLYRKTWHKVDDPAIFYEKTLPFFLQNESFYNLPLGIAARLKTNAKAFGGNFYLYLLTQDSTLNSPVVGAIWWTPPYPLGFSELEPEDVTHFFDVIQLPNWPTGIIGHPDTAKAFVKNLGGSWDDAPEKIETQNQGIYSLTQLTNSFVTVPGSARQAVLEDFELVLAWSEQFIIDCKSTRPNGFEALVRQAIADGTRLLWCVDGRPVSMAGTAGLTPNGARVAWVYTPPQMRGRGYAGAVTRAVTARQLAEGRKFCFLYTDMANPTSNSIYQKIGYQYVASSQHLMVHP